MAMKCVRPIQPIFESTTKKIKSGFAYKIISTDIKTGDRFPKQIGSEWLG
jgi:hypothetical protein